MKNKLKSAGFTLIEVLVALVILAIAFAAVMKAINQATQNLITINDRVAAHWVAQNVIVDLQAGLLPLPTNAPTSGKMQMLNKSWDWSAVIDDHKNPSILRIAVTVSFNGKNSARLMGFVSQ